jgi:hypothetical protein
MLVLLSLFACVFNDYERHASLFRNIVLHLKQRFVPPFLLPPLALSVRKDKGSSCPISITRQHRHASSSVTAAESVHKCLHTVHAVYARHNTHMRAFHGTYQSKSKFSRDRIPHFLARWRPPSTSLIVRGNVDGSKDASRYGTNGHLSWNSNGAHARCVERQVSGSAREQQQRSRLRRNQEGTLVV